MKTISSRAFQVLATASLVAALAGCYVVPLQPVPVAGAAAAPSPAVVPAVPVPLAFTARLYPSNDAASALGVVAASVTNDLNGRGHFTTAIGGESFAGEATRVAGSSRDGVANGAGNRGNYIHCRYTMNSATLGTGSCRHSSGATFTMHIGN